MSAKTLEVAISPVVLKWARESAGYLPQDVARRFHLPIERIEARETTPGPARLTLRQMEELARFYKRPTAALLLREPPSEPSPPRDFRRSVQSAAPFSPDLRLAFRRARRFQRLAREMMESMDLSHVSDVPQASLSEDPEAAAIAQRQLSGIGVPEQFGWKSPSEAFRKWREGLEKLQVLVFQADFPRQEAEGFSLPESHPYSIVVSTKDPPTARSFTLFHEFAHLLLRQGGICLTEEAPPQDGNSLATIEDWCNRFAEAFLVGSDPLRERGETRTILKREAGYQQALRRLASLFNVSQYVILFRLRHLGLINKPRLWAEYSRVREEAAIAAAEAEKREKRKGGASPARRAVQERGRLLTRLILDGLERAILSDTEAIAYLGVRLKHLEKVRQEAYG